MPRNPICLDIWDPEFYSCFISKLAPCLPPNPCAAGEGVCQSNDECKGSLICGYNEGACNSTTMPFPLTALDSCCTDRYRCQGFHTYNGCCTADTPCGKGDGDCDSDGQCQGELTCGNDNCSPETGFSSTYDCCAWNWSLTQHSSGMEYLFDKLPKKWIY